jgi:Uncharacterized protein conserved in bacteria (DUF2169)
MLPAIIIAQPDVVRAPSLARAAIAVAPHDQGFTIIAKLRGEIREDASGTWQVVLDREPPALVADPVRPLQGDSDELRQSTDFTAAKAHADIVLVGHAHAAEPAKRIACSIELPGLARRFTAVSDRPARAIPLRRTNLRSDGEATEGVGPVVVRDGDVISCAEPLQRAAHLQPGARLSLRGLWRGAQSVDIVLPAVELSVWVEADERQRIEMRCDTLWLDVDERVVVLLWRGLARCSPGAARRIVASVEPSDAPRDEPAILSSLQRGRFGYATRAEDVRGGGQPPPEAAEALRLARYQTWSEPAPPAELTLEQYAFVSVELGECGTPGARERALAKQGYDEDSWLVEERGWLERMAHEALDGDGTLAEQYSAHFLVAQQRYDQAPSPELPFDQYLALQAATIRGEALMELLAERQLTLPQWMRVDRHFQTSMGEDDQLAERYRVEMEAAIADVESGDDDDEVKALADAEARQAQLLEPTSDSE